MTRTSPIEAPAAVLSDGRVLTISPAPAGGLTNIAARVLPLHLTEQHAAPDALADRPGQQDTADSLKDRRTAPTAPTDDTFSVPPEAGAPAAEPPHNAPAAQEPRPVGVEVLKFQALLLGPESLEQAASALTSELASALGFDRVSLALTRGAGLRMIALSHSAEFDGRQAMILRLSAAMQEAIGQNVSIVYPPAPATPPRILLAHAALLPGGAGSILTVPLISNGQAIGALCFERACPVAANLLRSIELMASVLAHVIDLKRRAERSWREMADEAVRNYWRGRTRNVRRLAWIGALAAIPLLAMIPLGYRVGAPARLEGQVQRVIAAPMDGYLHAVHARPGDLVKAGQLLVELADQDILLQNRKWEAELNQHENTAMAALARADRAQFALAEARAAEAGAQLDLSRAQLLRSRLTAPIDGLLIKGDLSQSLGAPVQRGEILLTLAPSDAFRLMIEVDDRDIGAVAIGASGQLALSALPGDRIEFTVARITPVAVNREGRNAFEIEADFATPPSGLRPGLEGVAKIDAGSRSLGWIATHRIGEWLDMILWTWRP